LPRGARLKEIGPSAERKPTASGNSFRRKANPGRPSPE